MKLTVTGRHVDVSDRLNDQLEKKVTKIERYFTQIIDVQVIVFEERDDKVVEIIITADGGKFYSMQKGGDYFSCIDLLVDKLEQQVKKYKDKQQRHKGPGSDFMPVVNLETEKEDEVAVIEASSKPLDFKEAYLEMKMDNLPYMLFKKDNNDIDYANKNYALIYVENEAYFMIDVPDSMIETNDFKGTFNRHRLEVKKDSSTNPEIELVSDSVTLIQESMGQALGTFEEKKLDMYPFFNTEMSALNLLFRKSQGVEVAVPAR